MPSWWTRAETGFSSLEEVADAVAAYNPHRPKTTDLAGLRKNLPRARRSLLLALGPAIHLCRGRVGSRRDPRRRPAPHAAERMVADAPVMLVRGRVSDLVSEDKAAQFCARFPAVEFVDVSGAGHMVAGDRNDAFTVSVVEFLERHTERTAP